MNSALSARDPNFSAIDVAIIEGIRRGLRDDEIAQAQGLAEAWVTERVSFLCESLSLSGRSALGAWNPSGESRAAEAPRPAAPAPVAKDRRGSLTRRGFIGAGIVAAVAGAAGSVAWLRAGDPAPGPARLDPASDASPSPRTPTLAPSAAPTVVQGITETTHEFETLVFAPEQRIEQTQGIFFMDVATGAIDALMLRTAVLGLPPGPYFVDSSEDNATVAFHNPTLGREWLVDRATGRASGWKKSEFSLVPGPVANHFLLEETRGGNGETHTGRFTVVRFNGGEVVKIGEFETAIAATLAPGPAIVTKDGRWITTWVRENGGVARLLQVEVATGQVTSLFQATAVGGVSPSLGLFEPSTGAHVASLEHFENSLNRRLGVPAADTQIVHRPGSGVADVSHPERGLLGGFLSPDSTLMVRDAPTRVFEGMLPGTLGELWPAIELMTPAGERKFGVLSAAIELKSRVGWHQPWLADSSAFVARVREAEPLPGANLWDQLGMALVAADGSGIERLPQVPGLEDHWGVRSQRFGPVASPKDAALLSYGGRHLFNWRTNSWLHANLASPSYFSSRPWRQESSEMTFTLPGNSIGEPPAGRPTLLPPVIRSFPAVRPFALATAQSAPLRATASEAAGVIQTLPGGSGLQLEDLPPGSLEDNRLAVTYSAGEAWIHVRSASAGAGWVKLQDVEWA